MAESMRSEMDGGATKWLRLEPIRLELWYCAIVGAVEAVRTACHAVRR